MPLTPPPDLTYGYVDGRLTDSPEAPIVLAGQITVKE